MNVSRKRSVLWGRDRRRTLSAVVTVFVAAWWTSLEAVQAQPKEEPRGRSAARPSKRTPTPRRTPRQPTSTPPTADGDFVGPPLTEHSATLSEVVQIDPEDVEKPAEERMYRFSIKDGTYADLIDGFERATGIPVIGPRPQGGPVNFVTTEEMSFRAMLNRVRLLLFKHPESYWMFPGDGTYEIVQVTEGMRLVPEEYIFTNVSEFQAANLDDNELAMLLYTPEEGTVDELQPLRDFLPDYVRIAQFEKTNSMTIFALVKDISKYLRLIQKFSTTGKDPRDFHEVRVEYITASEALGILKQMVDGFSEEGAPRRRPPRGAAASSQAWGIESYPDDTRGRILFKAVPEHWAQIQEWMPRIDVAPEGIEFEPVIIPLQHTRVEQILEVINPILTGTGAAPAAPQPRGRGKAAPTPGNIQSVDVTIIPQPSTNSLIVLADEEGLARVRKLVAQFDVEVPDTLQLVELENGDPEELANAAQQLYNSVYASVTGSVVTFMADPGGKGVFVVGGPKNIEDGVDIVKRLDVPPVGGEATLHKARLRNAKPSAVAAKLQAIDAEMAPSPVTVPPAPGKQPTRRAPRQRTQPQTGTKFQGDDTIGILYVLCSDVEWEEDYWPLIQELDADAVPLFSADTVAVSYADPVELVTSLQATLTGMGLASTVQLVPGVGEITVLNASPEVLERVTQLVAQFDVDPTKGIEQRTFSLEFIEPSQVMELIRTLILDGGTGAAPPPRRPRPGQEAPAPVMTAPMSVGDVRMAELGDSLFVWAPTRIMQQIAELIEQIDVAQDESEFRVYTFSRGTDVRELVQQLSGFFPEGAVPQQQPRRGRRGGPATTAGATVRFVPQPASNRILVSAPSSMFGEIEEVIELLRTDEETPEYVQVRFFDLEHIGADAIANLLSQFMQMKFAEAVASGAIKESAAGPGKAAAGGTILVEPDPASGRLMVVGPGVLMPEAEALVSELDRPGNGERIIRTVQLDKADAQEMAQTITAMLSGHQPAPAPRRAKGARPGQPVSIGVPSEVTVIPAPGGSAIVLVGYPREVEEAESWIKKLDAEAAGSTIMKVYNFVHTDVEKFADSVMSLFDSAGGTGKGKSTDEFEFESYGGPRVGKDIRLVTDPYSDTMLVNTTPAKMQQIDVLYAKFEGTKEEERVIGTTGSKGPVLMYELKHADAYDAVFNLESLLDAVLGEENAPKVDYIAFTDILTIRGNPDVFPQVEDLIKQFIDKESETEKGTVVAVEEVTGLGVTPSELAMLLKMRTPTIQLDIENVEPEETDYNKLLERVTPTTPAIPEAATEEGGADASCVLPAAVAVMINSAMLGDAETNGVAAPPDDKKEEKAGSAPKSEVPTKEKLFHSIVGGATTQEADEEEKKEPSSIKVRVDDKSGVLMFEGTAKDVSDLKDVLDEVKKDLEKLSTKPDIRVYRLKNVDVRVAGQILEAMFNQPRQRVVRQPQRQPQQRGQQPGQPPQPGQPEVDEKGRPRPGQEEQQQPQIVAPEPATGEVRVFPDTRTRTIIVRASTEDYPTIVELLATIDKPGQKSKQFKIIELTKLNAARVEEMLKSLLGIGRTPTRTPRMPRVTNPAQAAALAEQMADQIFQFEMEGVGEGAINIAEEVEIASNPSTNSIMVMGPGDAISLVEEFVHKLEEQEVPAREVRTYELEFADATEVAPQLEKLFQTGRRADRPEEGFSPNEINDPTIVVSAERNALVINALSIDFEKIEPLIRELDQTDPDIRVMEFPLKFTDAVNLAKTLNSVYGGRGARAKGSAKKVEIEGDPDTNTIFVSAPRELRDEITERITNAEAKAEAEAKPKVIKLKEAVPSALAQKLLEAFGQDRRGSGKISITGDDATKQLFVRAPDELIPQIESLIELLDQPTEDISIQIYKLKFARAPEVLEDMQRMVRDLLGQLRGSSVKLDVFSASADARSNSLIVMGGPTTFRLVQQVLDNIDQPTAAPIALETMVYALQRARADDVARTINALFRDRKDGIDPPHAEPNASTNTVLVRGTQDQHKEIKEQVIDKLEEYATTPAIPLVEKTFALIHMKADEAAATLDQFFTNRANALKAASPQGALNPAETTVSITPMVESNQIAVVASQENLSRVEQWLTDLDKEGVGTRSARTVKTYVMTYVDPNQAASAITASFRTSGRVAEKDQVTTSVVIDTQSVVVSASEENHEKIAELLAQIDVDTTATQRSVRVVSVEHADPEAVARALTEMFRPQGGRQQAVTISHTQGTDTLLVKANDREFEEVVAVLEQLDTAEAELGEIRTFVLKFTDAEEMKGILETYLQKPGAARGRGVELAGDVRISTSTQTNSLIVSGDPAEVDRLAAVIEKIDVEVTDAGTAPKILALQYAVPSVIEPVLTKMFVDSSRGPRGRGASATMTPVIVADDTTGSLIVRCNPADFSQIKDLVALLDNEDAAGETGVKIIRLAAGVDVEEMAGMLQEVFDADARAKSDLRGTKPENVTISADRRTNSLLLAGAQSRFAEVEAIVRNLEDMGPVGGRTAAIIRPRNLDPEEVKRVIEGVIEDNQGSGSPRGRSRSPRGRR